MIDDVYEILIASEELRLFFWVKPLFTLTSLGYFKLKTDFCNDGMGRMYLTNLE